jgi:hypothetical protein
MIALIFYGLFLYGSSLTLFLHSPIFSPMSPPSLASPLRASSVIMVVSSITHPPARSFLHMVSPSACPVLTPRRKMARPSALFAQPTISFAPSFFTPACPHPTGLRLFIQSHIFLIATLLRLWPQLHLSSPCSEPSLPMTISEFLDVAVTRTFPPQLSISWHLAQLPVSSLAIPLNTKGIAVLISPPIELLSPAM